MIMKHTRTLALALLVITACSKDKADPPAAKPAPTPAPDAADASVAPQATQEWYRATVGEQQGTAIPFFLQVPPAGNDAFIVTGPDRVRATIASRGPELVLEFGVLRTKLKGKPGANGVLEGTFESTSGSWGAATLSFRAEPIDKPEPTKRFPTSAGPDALGVWKLKFPDQVAKLTLRQGEGAELLGTINFQTGNNAFLSGTQEGSTIRLSAFDGSSPYLFVGTLDKSAKKLDAQWTAGQALAWKEAVAGERTGDFELKIQTKLVAKKGKLKHPLLAQAPYAGNPVIVELGGTWCTACGHASKTLKALKDKYAADGLQIVMLAYEFTDDPAYNKEQAAWFKEKYEIPYDVIPVDGSLEKYNDILPPELADVDASGFPLTLFVARDGTIAGFHNGFPPETWGEGHKKTVAAYEQFAAAIAKK